MTPVPNRMVRLSEADRSTPRLLTVSQENATGSNGHLHVLRTEYVLPYGAPRYHDHEGVDDNESKTFDQGDFGRRLLFNKK